MGPSGSGKTTLLNVLAGRDAAGSASVSGTVLMEGKRFRKQALREVSTFVEQEDALIGTNCDMDFMLNIFLIAYR